MMEVELISLFFSRTLRVIINLIQPICAPSECLVHSGLQQSMQPLIPFDSLSDQQQIQVLKYIEATNIETVDDAIRVLQKHNMKADDALRTNSNSQTQHSYITFYTPDQEEEIAEYTSFLREESAKRVSCSACLAGCGRAIKRFLKRIVPKCVRKLFGKNRFTEIYQSYTQVNLFQGPLQQAYFKGQIQQKPVALFFSRSFSKRMGYILHNQETATLLNNRFISMGFTDHTTQDLQYLFQDITQPCLIIAYQTLFGKINILGKYRLQSVDKPMLERVVEQYRVQRRHQKNIVIRYNNKLMVTYFENEAENYIEDEIPENDDFYESKTIRDQQTRQYEQASNIRLRQQQEEEQAKRSIEQMLQQRSIRKTSISEEPSHDNIVTLSFRCPAGKKLMRKFGLDEVVENIYTWVETNDEIEFEEDPIRNFDLLRGYPPQSMALLKDQTIQEAFEDQYQIITIKEI